ncbi:HAMP domain-containing sensor histidine kinase [Mucilaginibacter sp. CAU 1740]|uniref:sensor histidine kinase n=1 Tax=Mucilaginibacter sp. CAU 1740 TaxID=3140365 RepID=UPI00325B87E4
MKNYVLACLLGLSCFTGCQGQTPAPVDSAHVNTYKQFTDSAKRFAAGQDTDKALYYHKKALAHARRHGLHEHEARALVHIALLLKGQRSDQSLAYLNGALQIAEGLDKPELCADILKAISSVYKQQQNYKESLAALEAHQKLLQAVFEKSRKKEAEHLRADAIRTRERTIGLTVTIALALLTGIFAYYYRSTRRLNKALAKSNQIKDTLFSIIGHDLRGPAGGIMQALEMVDAGLLDEEEQKEVISLLKQQSRTFNETLNTLLNWASAQLKGAQPKVASINAMDAIQRSLDLLKAQAAVKAVRIKQPDANGLTVLADSDQFDFVVRNLISNAIKFSYPGGEIDITAEKKADEAVIAVHDNGQGIPADKQRELFEEGRLNSTFGTKGEKGTGLGLMLSLDFIRANGGRIWCQSREGSGTTFFVSLPLVTS